MNPKGLHLKSRKSQNHPVVSHQTMEKHEFEGIRSQDRKGWRELAKRNNKDKKRHSKQRQEINKDAKFDFEEVKFSKEDRYMHFLNVYKSKYADFDIPVFYHNSSFYKSHWSDKLPPAKRLKSKKKSKPEKAKYDAFMKAFAKIADSVAKSTEKASLAESKKIYRTIHQKMFEPTDEEKLYFERFGLPNSVVKHKKLKKGDRDYDAFFDLDSVNSGLKKGDFLEGNIRMNEFNKNVAYISVDGLSNDIILTSEKDQNRAMDRDKVVVRLIDPKYWEPMRKAKSGMDNDKSIRELTEGKEKAEEERKAAYLQEIKGDEAVDDAEDEAKEESEDLKEESEDLKEESENLKEESEDSDDVKSDVNKSSEEENESSENNKSILKIIKNRKKKMRKDRGKKDRNNDNGLKLPSNIKSTEMLIEWINTVAKDFRPKGKVVFIKESVHFGKDVVMILRMGEKQLLHKLLNTKKDAKIKMIKNAKKDMRAFMKKHKTLAVPINKRLKWSLIDTLPDEFWEDVEKGEDPCKRYYL
jgi:hypothetical protein